MLTGDLVTLRPCREDDLDAMYELSAELDTWERRRPDPPRPLSRTTFVEQFRAEQAESRDDALFVIEVDGTVVGRCVAFHVDRHSRSCEVGLGFVPSARGKGYGTDALRVLVAFLFDRWNLRRVHLSTLASNAAALASYRKVGFVEEGRRREHAFVSGHYEDEVIMGLLRSEWLAGSSPA